MQRVRAVAAFFAAPLMVISIVLLFSAMGLGILGGLRSSAELAGQLFTFLLAELISVLPVSWYAKQTGRDGYLLYALAAMLALTMIGGYFTYKGVEVFKSQHPFGYESGAIRRALLRSLALCAVEGAALGICYRAVAGRRSRRQNDLDDLRERFE